MLHLRMRLRLDIGLLVLWNSRLFIRVILLILLLVLILSRVLLQAISCFDLA